MKFKVIMIIGSHYDTEAKMQEVLEQETPATVLSIQVTKVPAPTAEQASYIAGLRQAAELVRSHWNDSTTLTNQKEQAMRSAAEIERYATDCEHGYRRAEGYENCVGG